MVLDGIEYVLIPKDTFEASVGIEKEEVVEQEIVAKPEAYVEKVSVKVVETMPGVKKAQPSVYGYAQRLKKKALVPEDVMVVKTNFEAMPESPEIAKNDFKDKSSAALQKAKFGFYGPGAERDIG